MKKKILLIEDNREVRENTSEILELSGYEVATAENGKIGAELAISTKPDLIICDIMMPVLDGYGVLHLLSRNESTAGIPFIFLTAKAERGDFRKGMEMGADDYLTKPFDDVELLSAIESRLRRHDSFKRELPPGANGLSELISDAKKAGLADLTAEREVRKLGKKETIYAPGDRARYLFLVLKGKVRTYRTNADGKDLVTGLFGEGEFFGYTTLLREDVYEDAAAAMEDSEIALVPKEDFLALLHSSSEVSRKFISLLSGHIRDAEEQLLRLAYQSVRKRVAQALLQLEDKYKSGSAPVSFSIPRQDLAALAGTALETTIRTLSDFREEDLISLEGGMLTIKDSKALQRMKN